MALKTAAGAHSHFTWVAILVGGVVAALSFRVLGFDWVLFDDDINILTNPFLGRGAGSSVGWAFSQLDYIRRYVPLGWLWFDGVLGLDGYNATVFHATSIALHSLNAVIAGFVFRSVLRRSVAASAREAAGCRIEIAAALGALLWSVHPLRAENVGWISGQFYLLATTFALLAVGSFVRATDENGAGARSHRFALAGVFCFTASLLVYPVYLALPAVLTLWRIGLQPTWRAAFAALRSLGVWWVVALAVVAINAYAAATATGGFAWAGPRLSAVQWISHCASVYAHYAASTVWPVDVTVFYGAVNFLLAATAAKLSAAFAFAVLAGALAVKRTRRGALILVGGFLVSFAPFLAQMDATFTPSDRYAVVWLGVLSVVAAAGLVRVGRPAWFVIGAAVAVVWSAMFWPALGQWRDTFALQRAIDGHNASRLNAKMNFGRPAVEFWWLGHRADATRRLAKGLELFPNEPGLLGTKAFLAGLDERYRSRVGEESSVPPLAMWHVDLGNQWLARGERSAARAHFAAALRLAPEYREALEAFRRAVEAN